VLGPRRELKCAQAGAKIRSVVTRSRAQAVYLTGRVAGWRNGGDREEVRGRRLFVYRREGDGPLLLLLHGFPSSSYDWRGLLEHLPNQATLAFDFLGFGLSDKPAGHVYSLAWQADAVEELLRRAGSPATVVVAHDMGTSVATELMARDLAGELTFPLERALLFNASILLDRASPTVGQRLLRSPGGALFARLTMEATFRRQFARLFSPGHPLTRAEAADQWCLLAHDGGAGIAHRLIHYMDERERLTARWHGAFRDWPGDLALAWGLRDPVATTNVLSGLRELRSGVPVIELPQLGHYPQIEDPAAIAAAVSNVLSRG
jgi:pimeloyl-ACP methyl ester carboxylesterase